MANLRDAGLPSNLQALESTAEILQRQIKDMEKSVERLSELRLDLDAVEKAINALTGRVVFPVEDGEILDPALR
jgi:prefoldin subunit 5